MLLHFAPKRKPFLRAGPDKPEFPEFPDCPEFPDLPEIPDIPEAARPMAPRARRYVNTAEAKEKAPCGARGRRFAGAISRVLFPCGRQSLN